MDLLRIALIAFTLLSGLVAGFVFAFTIVVMPGLKTLGDDDFLRAFKAIDRVIQNNQPIFIVVWVGSVVALAAALFLGIGQLDRLDRLLLIGSAALYLLGVQLPTATINVPLNNQLQRQNLDGSSESDLRQARRNFEPCWTRWNAIRTACAAATTAVMLILLLRLRACSWSIDN